MLNLLRLLNSDNDLHKLIREATALLQEWSGCEAVGIRLKEGEDYPYFETRGFPADFVKAESSQCIRDLNEQLLRDNEGNPVLECMCGNVLCGRFDASKPFFTQHGSFWTNSTTQLLASTTEADRQARTRNRCNGEGYESVALISLRGGGEIFGLVQCNDSREGRFTAEKIAMLERAAGSLAIALRQRQSVQALRESELSLRQSEAGLAAAQRIAHIGSWERDLHKGTSHWSDETYRILGFTPGQVESHHNALLGVLHPTVREQVEKSMNDALNEAREYDIEYRICLPDGSEKIIHCQAEFVRDELGKPVTLRGTIHDITERKQAEEEKTKLQSQLLQAQKLESVGQLAGGVAHDFNNLLTVINGYGDLLLRRLKEGDPLREPVAEIRRAGEQGAALTKQLLVFSREQMIEPKPLDVNDLIKESQVMLERLVGEDIQVETILDPSLGFVMSDPGRLHQILMNLAANARDAMPSGGNFTIKTLDVNLGGAKAESLGLTPGRFVRLQLSDTGSGIPKEILERIFDPFFTTKGQGKGTGLGLATVYGVVRQSGGAISVVSEPEQGTTFDIYLPRVEMCVLDCTGAIRSPENLHGIETILVVEDRPEVRRLAVDTLQDNGYHVLEAAEGREALQVAKDHSGPIHLLLTDVIMPHMTGKEAAERLRQLRPEIKVLYMSGYAADVISSRGSLTSGELYIAKPFSLDSLLTKVREILSSPEVKS
jgi:PAS domain S-box-containing protein